MVILSARRARKGRPNLERQAIFFTVGLYLFICVTLLAVHYAVPEPSPEGTSGSSSTSPFNPAPTATP